MGQAPSNSLRVNPNYDERIILKFEPRACCGTSEGFIHADQLQLPVKLQGAGVTLAMWDEWIQDYQKNVAPQSNLCGWVWALIIGWIFLIPGIILTFCYDYGKKSPFQRAAREWLDRVNEQAPKNVYAKFQTMIEQYERTRIETSTLSFAITAEECEVLRSEPILVVPACFDCCGDCFVMADKNRVV